MQELSDLPMWQVEHIELLNIAKSCAYNGMSDKALAYVAVAKELRKLNEWRNRT